MYSSYNVLATVRFPTSPPPKIEVLLQILVSMCINAPRFLSVALEFLYAEKQTDGQMTC